MNVEMILTTFLDKLLGLIDGLFLQQIVVELSFGNDQHIVQPNSFLMYILFVVSSTKKRVQTRMGLSTGKAIDGNTKILTVNVSVTFSSSSKDGAPLFCTSSSRHPEIDGQLRMSTLPS